MEYVSGGSVKDRLNKERAFNETQAKRYTRQMLLGVSYLHKQRIIHRDLKCEPCPLHSYIFPFWLLL